MSRASASPPPTAAAIDEVGQRFDNQNVPDAATILQIDCLQQLLHDGIRDHFERYMRRQTRSYGAAFARSAGGWRCTCSVGSAEGPDGNPARLVA